MNESNLRNLKTRTKQERLEIAKKGNQASLKVKKEKKLLKDLANELLYEKELTSEQVQELKAIGITDKEMYNNATRIVVALINKSLTGDTKAFEKVMELTGEDNHFNRTLEIRERELGLKQRELELREKTINNGLDTEEDKTIIINIVDPPTKEQKQAKEIDYTKELETRGIKNPSTIIVNDIPKGV